MKIKAYLAGPDVFREDPNKHFNEIKVKLSTVSIEGLSPFDSEAELNNISHKEMSKRIFKANIELIDKCDIVFANIEPFRGVSLDPGTAFEIGYAFAKGKTVMLYGVDPEDNDLSDRTKFFLFKNQNIDNFKYPLIEDFGNTDNLMITESTTHPLFKDFDELLKYLQKIKYLEERDS